MEVRDLRQGSIITLIRILIEIRRRERLVIERALLIRHLEEEAIIAIILFQNNLILVRTDFTHLVEELEEAVQIQRQILTITIWVITTVV
jgi:hypothetical protein